MKWPSLPCGWNNQYPSLSSDGKQAPKKGSEYYLEVSKKYQDFIAGNELLIIPSALEAITRRTIPLLTSDVKTRKLVGVNREGLKEVLKKISTLWSSCGQRGQMQCRTSCRHMKKRRDQ